MLIQCKLGPREVDAGGMTYVFSVDEKGRAVAEVHHAVHQKVFLAVEHYAEVVDEDEIDISDAGADDEGEDPPEGMESPQTERPKRGRKPRN
jgi:hypothetical protein